MALFKVGVAGTYGAANTSYADITGNTDESHRHRLQRRRHRAYQCRSGRVLAFGLHQLLAESVVDLGHDLGDGRHDLQHRRRTARSPTNQSRSMTSAARSTVTGGTFTAIMPVAAVGTAILQIT
jgi:hypothetical protein